MAHKTRLGMSANKKRVFSNRACLAPSTPTSRLPVFACVCLKNAKKLGLFCRQVCTELRMIVRLVDLKGIINIA